MRQQFFLKPLPHPIHAELQTLNSYYRNHLLRYGGSINLLINPTSISYERLGHRLIAALRLYERVKRT
jgi:hypothetical protein